MNDSESTGTLKQRNGAALQWSSNDWTLVSAAAQTALAPYVREATEAGADWLAERWPDYVRTTLLPALSAAVAPDGDASAGSAHAAERRRAVGTTLAVGAAGAVIGAAGVLFARR